MKNYSLIFAVFCLFSSTANAQISWFQPADQWSYQVTGGFVGIDDDMLMRVGHDTVIGGQTYKQLQMTDLPFSVYPNRYVTQTGNQIFAWQADFNRSIMIYDFDMQPGDSLSMPSFFQANMRYVYQVLEVSEVFAAGTIRRKQICDYLNDQGQLKGEPFEIIEGIGSTGPIQPNGALTCGFFFLDSGDWMCGSVVDGFDARFNCFSATGGVYDPNGLCGSSPTGEPRYTAQVHIWPNPAIDLVQITCEQPVAEILVSDAAGRVKIYSNQIPNVLHVADWPAGVYYVRITPTHGAPVIKSMVVTR